MENLLEARNICTQFKVGKDSINIVKDVSFDVKKGKILSIVGESGCGKSVTVHSLINLLPKNGKVVGGHSNFQTDDGKVIDLTAQKPFSKTMRELRGSQIGMIFQDPLSALNPLQRIGEQIEEALTYHTKFSKEEKKARVLELLEKVGIENPSRVYRQFPHQLSGGMRQRVMIAMALSCKPKMIIADEPTTALDVTIQAQILDLLTDLQNEIKAGIILITHDLGVVAQMADRVAVMYAGQVVELADSMELFNNPLHPYTKSLLNSIPQIDVEDEKDLHVIQGMVPSLKNLPRQGCRFAPRIPHIAASSHEEDPQMHEVSPGHFVRCTCYKDFYFEEESV